jgi:LPXTG-site transpeptidase (sortase) family protein
MQTINQDKFLSWTRKAGIALIAVSVFVLLSTFFPVIKEEIKYQFSPKQNNALVATKEEAEKKSENNLQPKSDVIYPADEDFGIVIPKISANAKVIADVNWQDSAIYQRALTKGVAHAAGTAYPGQLGNVFIFSHSGVDFYEAARYNAQFYLLNKLVPSDEIYLFYKKQKLVYKVTEQKIVAPENVEYLKGDPAKKTLTLMTCWPAGTTLRRLIVIAEQAEN